MKKVAALILMVVIWTFVHVVAFGEKDKEIVTNSPIHVIDVIYTEEDFAIVPSKNMSSTKTRVARSFDKFGKGGGGGDDIFCKIFKKKCGGGYRQQSSGYGPPRPRPVYGQQSYRSPVPVYGQQYSNNKGGKFSKFDNIGDKISRKIQALFSKFDKGDNGGNYYGGGQRYGGGGGGGKFSKFFNKFGDKRRR